MSFTNAGEPMILNRCFTATSMKSDGVAGSTSFTPGTDDFYISLHETDPGEAGSTTGEVAGPVNSTGYERKVISFTALSAVGNQIASANQVQWANIGATWRSGNNIGYFGIHLTSTGTMIAKGSFTVAKPATSGDTVTIAIGDITITLD